MKDSQIVDVQKDLILKVRAQEKIWQVSSFSIRKTMAGSRPYAKISKKKSLWRGRKWGSNGNANPGRRAEDPWIVPEGGSRGRGSLRSKQS